MSLLLRVVGPLPLLDGVTCSGGRGPTTLNNKRRSSRDGRPKNGGPKTAQVPTFGYVLSGFPSLPAKEEVGSVRVVRRW